MGPPRRDLLDAVPGLRAQLRRAVVLGVGESAMTIAQALLLAHAIAIGVGARDEAFAPTLIGLVVAVLLRAGFAAWSEIAGRAAGRHAVAILRERAVGLALRRAATTSGARRPGELATSWVHGADAVATYAGRYLPASVVSAIAPLLVLAAVLVVDPLSAGLLLIAVPIVVVFLILVGSSAQAAAEQRHASMSLLGGHLLDVLRGLPVLRAYNREQAQASQVLRAGEHYREGTMATLRQAFLSGLVLEFMAMLGTALVAVACGIRLAGGHMEFAPAIAALVLAPEVFLPLRKLGAEFHASADAEPLLRELAAAAKEEEEVDGARPDRDASSTVAGANASRPRTSAGADGPATPGTSGPGTSGPGPAAAGSPTPDPAVASSPIPDPAVDGLRLDAVTVRHGDRLAPALDALSATIPGGATALLVGPSGSGKTTLLRLLLGLRTADAGTIRCGAVDLAQIDLARWHEQVAWIPQHPVLLPATLRENVRFGRDADDPAIHAALAEVGLGPLVATLADGLDAPLGDGGLPLSAGERRRLGVARALLREPRLVLVDEPTANLDRVTAEQLTEVLGRLVAGRTAVIATHDELPRRLADLTVDLTAPSAPIASFASSAPSAPSAPTAPTTPTTPTTPTR